MEKDKNEIIEIPRKILEALASAPLGGKARGACLYLISKGGTKIDNAGNQISIPLPLIEWAKVLDCSSCYVANILNELVDFGIIIRVKHLPGKTGEYIFNRKVEKWSRENK